MRRLWAAGYHVTEGCLYYDWNDIYEEMSVYLFYDSRLNDTALPCFVALLQIDLLLSDKSTTSERLQNLSPTTLSFDNCVLSGCSIRVIV